MGLKKSECQEQTKDLLLISTRIPYFNVDLFVDTAQPHFMFQNTNASRGIIRVCGQLLTLARNAVANQGLSRALWPRNDELELHL